MNEWVCSDLFTVGGSLHLLRGTAGPMGAAGVVPGLLEGGSTVPPPATGTGLALHHLRLHAHGVSQSYSH